MVLYMQLILHNNVPPISFHPDLLSDDEYKNLFARLEVANLKLKMSKSSKNVERYQTLCDSLNKLICEQRDIRAKCWFTELLGVPKLPADKAENDNSVVNKDTTVVKNLLKNEKAESFNMSVSDVESVSDISSKVDSVNYIESECDSADTDAIVKRSRSEIKKAIKNLKTIVKASKLNQKSHPKKEDKKMFDVSFSNVAAPKFANNIVEKIEAKDQAMNQNETNVKQSKDNEYVPKNDFEMFKIQFAEMKAENEKLKNSVEKLVASQIIV
uniref:Uncharacterized protein n=1 Tax=Panagrolaimus sp. ES5 TaxID=591445 RepID=A0AC34F5G5_9BILA